MKIVTNTIARARGSTSLGVASKERNNTKGGSRTREKTPRRRLSSTQQRRKGGFNSLGAALMERNSTKGSSRPLKNNRQQYNRKRKGVQFIKNDTKGEEQH
jgi:hypothetical protein